jgi:NADPH:quinone reductase-like Zn-dependent oxidoreductase
MFDTTTANRAWQADAVGIQYKDLNKIARLLAPSQLPSLTSCLRISLTYMSPSQYALLQGSLVLVSGANGYIASHIVDLLLQLGYNVRGTIQAEKGWLDKYFQPKYGEILLSKCYCWDI